MEHLAIFFNLFSGMTLLVALTLNMQPKPSPDQINETSFVVFGVTPREKEVIGLISMGMSNQEIGDKLYISVSTVKDHIYRIYRKVGVKNRVQLINTLK